MPRYEETAENDKKPLRKEGSETDLLGCRGEGEVEEVEVHREVVSIVLANEVVEVGFVQELPPVQGVE